MLSLNFLLTAALGVAPLMSGQGFFFIGLGQPGHYQVTEDVALAFGFARPAQLLLADAVMDPDFYEWDHAAAHAQTGNDEQGRQSETQPEAVKHLYAWLDDKVIRVQERLRAGQPREALYWLGYGLHAIEDLAAHQGITNGEHSYLSAIEQNPDLRPQALEEARRFAYRFLWVLRDKLGEADWKRLLHDQAGPLGPREKDALIGHGWDLSLPALLVYKAQGDFYHRQAERSQIHWNTDQVLSGYLERLE